jgi:hypothetical protein
MVISFKDIGHHLHRHTSIVMRPSNAGRLYAYGFSLAEEAGVRGRLEALEATPAFHSSFAI